MKLTIDIPTRAQIINGGFELTIAQNGDRWLKSQLGGYADKRGVYILHVNGIIFYIGKTTTGEFGKFAERLRRHCHQGPSSNSTLYRFLKAQKSPVRAYLLCLEDIDMMIDQAAMKLTDIGKALIMEQALIGVFNPSENRSDATPGINDVNK